MNKIISLILFLLIATSVIGQDVYVKGYYKKNGTYVQPYYRTAPDGTLTNNFSYPGNYNPYTGKIAGGSTVDYINSYQKVYPAFTDKQFNTYTTLLKNTNYSFLRKNKHQDYLITEKSNPIKPIGYVYKTRDKDVYKLMDENNKYLGMVYFNTKNYNIYDSEGQFLMSSNSNKGTSNNNGINLIYAVIFGFLTVIGALTL